MRCSHLTRQLLDFLNVLGKRSVTIMFNYIQVEILQSISKTWLKSLVPANVISGFKTCGIYPFDPKAILDHDLCNQMTTQTSGILL